MRDALKFNVFCQLQLQYPLVDSFVSFFSVCPSVYLWFVRRVFRTLIWSFWLSCVHLALYRYSNGWRKIFAWNSYNFSVKPSHFRNIFFFFFGCLSFILHAPIFFSFSHATWTHMYIFFTKNLFEKNISFLPNWMKIRRRMVSVWNRNQSDIMKLVQFFTQALLFLFFFFLLLLHTIAVINFSIGHSVDEKIKSILFEYTILQIFLVTFSLFGLDLF